MDELISMWLKEKEISSFLEEGSPHRAFFYISGNKFNTFQFVFEHEENGVLRFDVHLIESQKDSVFHCIFEIDKENIIFALNCAYDIALSFAEK